MIHEGKEVYGVIYMVTNNINGKVYIGQTTDLKKRLNSYRTLHCKAQTKLYRSIIKYGFEKFTINVIDTVINQKDSKKILDYWEKLYIRFFNSIKNGYNCNSGGGGWTPDRKKEYGKSVSGENNYFYGKRLFGNSNGFYGKKHKKETNEINRKAHLGKKPSKEAREKNSKALKGMFSDGKSKCCKRVKCITTDTVYFGLREAERKTGIKRQNIYHNLKGTTCFAGKLPDGTKLTWEWVR
jgi:group I intron endonuclease